MKIGTKTILFGYHQFFIHPIFVALGWWKCFGFPFDPRLWVCFFIHDLGYFGKSDIDGQDGKTHPEFGAKIASRLFDEHTNCGYRSCAWHPWRNLCLHHSRQYAQASGNAVSKLAVADKMAIVIQPAWMTLTLMSLTGEIHEYMARNSEGEGKTRRQFIEGVKQRTHDWIKETGYMK